MLRSSGTGNLGCLTLLGGAVTKELSLRLLALPALTMDTAELTNAKVPTWGQGKDWQDCAFCLGYGATQG